VVVDDSEQNEALKKEPDFSLIPSHTQSTNQEPSAHPSAWQLPLQHSERLSFIRNNEKEG
jgi:hypothetical protein